MNENEMNAQDVLTGEELLPKAEDSQTNFMEDFLKVASEEKKENIDLNEEKTEFPVSENIISENQNVEETLTTDQNSINQEVFNQPEPVKTEISSGIEPVQVMQTVQTSEPLNQNSNLVSEPTEVGQISKENVEIKVQKKNHWKFIFTLFGIVAIFVLLLPLFIKWFGY